MPKTMSMRTTIEQNIKLVLLADQFESFIKLLRNLKNDLIADSPSSDTDISAASAQTPLQWILRQYAAQPR